MTVTKSVYIRMKRKIITKQNTKIILKDVALITTTKISIKEIEDTHVYSVTKEDNDYVIIDSFLIIRHLNKKFPELEFHLIGPNETIVHIADKKAKPSVLLVSFVWIVLFIGTAMTIINFHYDVSMQEVHQKIHYLFTGREEEFPLWIQIPYSIGLGVGMVLFLNKWFKKRFNEEPSPLEVEIYKYQQDLDNYVAYHENEINKGDYHS